MTQLLNEPTSAIRTGMRLRHSEHEHLQRQSAIAGRLEVIADQSHELEKVWLHSYLERSLDRNLSGEPHAFGRTFHNWRETERKLPGKVMLPFGWQRMELSTMRITQKLL